MKDPGGVLNGLKQAKENWFSDDGFNQVSNASVGASIQSSPFFTFFSQINISQLKTHNPQLKTLHSKLKNTTLLSTRVLIKFVPNPE